MNFSYYDFGHLERGRIVEVQLSAAANVRLMDSTNYSNYKNGRRHRYYGGYVTRSPYRITVPNSGHWYLTIDLGGYAGKVKHSARVLSGILPAAREPLPLAQETNLYVDNTDLNKEYDVFISHASEDKDSVVRPLAIALKNKGVNVWYDEFELKIGDSLRRKIDHGLSKSKFGIVVISRSFIKKGWTNYELDGLMTKAISGQQILLPIWHDITKQEVIDYSPSLADKVARNTSQETVEEIAEEIAELIVK
ncbi:DUF1883 domain-containing protein [Ruminococcus sp.]|uniref:DUF1883 domain-containing protein n=1 Tax=Ruminococcus sp. TaxID=41978 RepID=UPI00262E2AF3|nr:DUF1883 domain-containing protein [Ruminococcus sp.]MDD6990091.1 DUF1883 domain-containing protein [Ruminococcus sp.]MDY6201878.1 DUF1883 domain-containing protein [Ruminococcus sp.]